MRHRAESAVCAALRGAATGIVTGSFTATACGGRLKRNRPNPPAALPLLPCARPSGAGVVVRASSDKQSPWRMSASASLSWRSRTTYRFDRRVLRSCRRGSFGRGTFRSCRASRRRRSRDRLRTATTRVGAVVWRPNGQPDLHETPVRHIAVPRGAPDATSTRRPPLDRMSVDVREKYGRLSGLKAGRATLAKPCGPMRGG